MNLLEVLMIVVFILRNLGMTLLYVLLYVDDMLVACDTLFEVENLKEMLSIDFEMKDLGEAKKILWIEIIKRVFFT